MLGNLPMATILPATDIARAKAFWQGMGLRVLMEQGGNVLFEAGDGSKLMVYERPAPTKAEHTVAGWFVDDVYDVVDYVAQHGGEIQHYDFPGLQTDEYGVADLDGVRGAWFKDSEGNIIGITEMP